MDKEKVEWYIKNIEVFASMIREEVLDKKPEIKTTSFETFHPIDSDDDIEYYDED